MIQAPVQSDKAADIQKALDFPAWGSEIRAEVQTLGFMVGLGFI